MLSIKLFNYFSSGEDNASITSSSVGWRSFSSSKGSCEKSKALYTSSEWHGTETGEPGAVPAPSAPVEPDGASDLLHLAVCFRLPLPQRAIVSHRGKLISN